MGLEFSGNGRQILVSGGDVKLWDVSTSKMLRKFTGLKYVRKAALSKDGRLVGFDGKHVGRSALVAGAAVDRVTSMNEHRADDALALFDAMIELASSMLKFRLFFDELPAAINICGCELIWLVEFRTTFLLSTIG